jgi:hypothetical protein
MGVGCSVSSMGIGYKVVCPERDRTYHELQKSDITFDKHSALMVPNHKKKGRKEKEGRNKHVNVKTIAGCGCSFQKEDKGRRTLEPYNPHPYPNTNTNPNLTCRMIARYDGSFQKMTKEGEP